MAVFSFKDDNQGVQKMASFVAVLITEGIVFEVRQDDYGFEIVLTGGH